MKHGLLWSFILLFSFDGVTQSLSEKNFRPDSFEDSLRVQRMQKAFPAIKTMYANYVRQHNIPGLAFGIVSGGKLVYSGAIGYNEIQGKQPATISSVFRIASMTKSFTAMAILKLRDEGKLDLDLPASKYIPELKLTPLLTADARPITIRNLLTHTAGFPEDNPWADRQLEKTDGELVEFLKKGISMAYNPGQGYEYSNLGFALLGHIITRVSGQSFEKYIEKNILVPLQMNNTYWEYSKVPADALVHGYRVVNNSWREEEILHSGAYGATGGLLTSIEDFSKYMMLHLSAWPANDHKESGPISRGLIREMHMQGLITRLRTQTRDGIKLSCPSMNSYNCGLAWSRDCSGRLTLDHSGGLPGFGSHWAFLPDYDLAVVSFTNLTYAAPRQLNTEVIDTLIKAADLKPRIIHTSSILEKRQQQLLQLLPDWKDAEKSGIFSENFFSDYFIDSLRKEAVALFSKAGKIISVGKVIPVNQLRGYFILTGEKTKLDIWFTLTPEKVALIQEYRISERRD